MVHIYEYEHEAYNVYYDKIKSGHDAGDNIDIFK